MTAFGKLVSGLAAALLELVCKLAAAIRDILTKFTTPLEQGLCQLAATFCPVTDGLAALFRNNPKMIGYLKEVYS